VIGAAPANIVAHAGGRQLVTTKTAGARRVGQLRPKLRPRRKRPARVSIPGRAFDLLRGGGGGI
jgi:hypothetical protein